MTLATDRYRAPPASSLISGDLLIVTRASTVASSRRSIALVTSTPTDLAGSYAPDYPAAALTPAATAPRLSGELPHDDGADLYYVTNVQRDSQNFITAWSQVYTQRWASGLAVPVAVPDLVGSPGWTAAVVAGEASVIQQWTASTKTTPLPGRPELLYVDGDAIVTSSKLSTLTVP
ncbi:MAG: hypothetical protein WKG01_30400 [Kofleriaceae bacterium]